MVTTLPLLLLIIGGAPAAPDTLEAVRCEGQPVRTIEVRAQRPPFKGQMALWRRTARALGLHHATTSWEIVRRFVTLEEGRPCSEFRRAESERLLRALPFLARASVRTFADSGGGVHVLVETVDEVPATGGAKVHKGKLTGLDLGTINLLGTGLTVEAGVEKGRGSYRDGISGRIAHYQFLGHPYMLSAEGVRDPDGDKWDFTLSHPVLTDLQRIAWLARTHAQREYLPLARNDDGWLALGVQRRAWDMGGVLRVGGGRMNWLVGGATSGERSDPEREPVWLLDTAIVAAPVALLDSSSSTGFQSFHAVRLGPMLGLRRLDFVTARGVDALTAEQDLARGVQLGVMLQRGVARQGADDWLGAADLFVGAGGQRSYIGTQLAAEGRRGRASSTWDGVLASGRAAWYLKPSLAWTSVVSVEGATGRRLRYPMLLELSSRDGGIRGLGGDPIYGTSRAVARVEERWFAGSVRNRGELGFALFTDVGRSWAGGNAFASTTPVIATAGLSVLAAVPRGAQRTIRFDVARAVRNAGGGFQFRLTMRDETRAFWREPGDIAHVRAARALMDVLSWP